MPKIKVGVVGAGGISSGVHLPLLSCIDNVSIEFIADTINPEVLGKAYNTKSIKINEISSLPDCDVVLLAIPVGVKEEYIREFSKRNTYIFTEKPFAIDLETHKNFLKLSNKISCNYMSQKRIHIFVTGRVQGVFFRQATRVIAIKNNVRGWVRNLDDGRVEIMIEGEDKSINSVTEWCNLGPANSRVDNIQINNENYLGNFKNFEVRY